MKSTVIIVLSVLMLLTMGCKETNNRKKGKRQGSTPKDNSITAILDISSDTVIIARGFDMLITYDNGKNWSKNVICFL